MGTRTAITKIDFKAKATIKNLLADGAQAMSVLGGPVLRNVTLAGGVEADQANRAVLYQFSIASAATLDIDLYDLGALDTGAGPGKDGLGQAWSAEEAVLLIIQQLSGAGRLEIMPTAPAARVTWVRAMTVANLGALRTNGIYMHYQPAGAGLDITDASNHILRLSASGGDITGQILLVARHDDDASSSSSRSSSSSSSKSSSTASSKSSSTSSSKSSSSTS